MFFILSLLALIVLILPFNKSLNLKKKAWFFIPLALVAIAYVYCGSWVQWRAHEQQVRNNKMAKTQLANLKNPKKLIARFETHLKKNPDSARGWYLLGRLYAGEGRWLEAKEAFATARQLEPQDLPIMVNYAQSLWQLNNQTQSEESKLIFLKALQINPKQPDALAMLAMDAYQQQQFLKAIDYWQRLLILVSSESQEANVIRQAIAQAQKSITPHGIPSEARDLLQDIDRVQKDISRV